MHEKLAETKDSLKKVEGDISLNEREVANLKHKKRRVQKLLGALDAEAMFSAFGSDPIFLHFYLQLVILFYFISDLV